ncbi:type VII toxin-antitoxin system HepT family RNase toxin [Pelovirga terrestris]
MPPDNVSFNKAAIIERCLRRMREEYEADKTLSNQTHLDALILNIERACQAAIDLAMHTVSADHLGMPQSSAESFKLLQQAGKIDTVLASRLGGMTGFRNIAIHQYQDIDPDVIHFIMREGWLDLVSLCMALKLKIKP